MITFDEVAYLAAVQSGDFSKLLAPQRQLMAKLRANPALHAGDPSGALGEITESAARLLEVARVGLWRFDEPREQLECLDMYILPDGCHERGAIVTCVDAPHYFATIETGEIVAAEDAYLDPRTAELGRTYLAANRVGALLDTPVMIRGRLAGVLCHEHVDGPRRWRAWERTLAASLSDCAGLILAEVPSSWQPQPPTQPR